MKIYIVVFAQTLEDYSTFISGKKTKAFTNIAEAKKYFSEKKKMIDDVNNVGDMAKDFSVRWENDNNYMVNSEYWQDGTSIRLIECEI